MWILDLEKESFLSPRKGLEICRWKSVQTLINVIFALISLFSSWEEKIMSLFIAFKYLSYVHQLSVGGFLYKETFFMHLYNYVSVSETRENN